MMNFGIQILHLKGFIAKISTSNIPSIELFSSKLGFTKVLLFFLTLQVKEIEAFQEVHYEIESTKIDEIELNITEL